MSDRELTKCKYCGAYLRDTYFKVISHQLKCPKKPRVEVPVAIVESQPEPASNWVCRPASGIYW